ncbi:hypothetical protein A0256_13915 [Mucilaginibacter sp. PAMC 26640]|nr:hypothetical protein A0256_13915 [Mucilaginibacter sp. PAMC 26640]
MENHNGQIVEYVVRRNGYSITDLATELKVNRRSIYNYFQNRNLKHDVIYKIGLIIRHDFAKEFPDLFNRNSLTLETVKPKVLQLLLTWVLTLNNGKINTSNYLKIITRP